MTKFCFWNDGNPVFITTPLRARSPSGVIVQSITRAIPELDVYEHVEVGNATPSAAGRIVTAIHARDGDTVTTTYTEADDPTLSDDARAKILAASKADAVRAIDEAAEAARLRYITAGAGQALVYARKEAQARACLAAYDAQNPPQAGTYPALDTEVGITAVDVIGVATVVVAMADLWAGIADTIEATRLGAKARVTVAIDTAGIDAVVAGLSWPQSA